MVSSSFLSKRTLAIFSVLLLLMGGCSTDRPLGDDLETLGLKSSYVRQFGTSNNDETTGVATDTNGNIYVAVNTSRNVAQNGSVDQSTLYKYDSSGNFVETKNPAGAPCCGYWNTYVKAITSDASGNLYVTGDYSAYKESYVYVDKYDSSGSFVWTRKFRDTSVSYLGDPTRVIANALSTDARGNVYIMAEKAPWPYQTRSVYVRKYASRGGLLWEKIVGYTTPYTSRPTMTTDAQGNIFTALASVNDTQQTNTRISKWDTQGNVLWSQSTNPPNVNMRTNVHGLTTDVQGNVYATGITNGSLEGVSQGSLDAFIRKYETSGNVSWTRQFGTSTADWANGIAADALGNIYVAGSTQGNLLATNKGDYDGFIRKYDTNGNALQARQFGTTTFDRGDKVTLDASKNVYVVGSTRGNMQGVNKGNLDTYIRKYTP